MNVAILQNGAQLAKDGRVASGNDTRTASPITLSELLGILATNPPKSFSMLRSTAAQIANLCNQPIEEITLDRVLEMRRPFRRYLEQRPYAENSIRSYVNYGRILIQMALKEGWRPYQNLSQDWLRVLALASRRKCTDPVRFLSIAKTNPRDVTPEDVENWAQIRLQEGASRKVVSLKKARLWNLLKECGITDHTPLSNIRAQAYCVPFQQFPQELRLEVERMLKWKTADFSIGRPKGGQIRQETASTIRKNICRLVGFATNIRGLSGVNSLSELIQKDFIEDFLSWCINERGVKGQTLRNHLGQLDAAMRQYPSFKSVDLSWFKPLLESLPLESESERRGRKERKYLEYTVIEGIPAKIHVDRLSLPEEKEKLAAEMAMHELLVKWLIVLPWRQRNIRECRVGGPHPNIFKAKIPTHIPIDIPDWIRNEQQRNPDAVFWQLHFVPTETKTGREIRAVLPHQLTKLLEQYLSEFRPRLLSNGDPGNLFVARDGRPMNGGMVHELITRLTWRYGGRGVNPHLFRDIVAFAWLKAHPRDYLSLSKILWHANINVTLRVYGSRFDESTGVCAMEDWLNEREAKGRAK
jgi:integrase